MNDNAAQTDAADDARAFAATLPALWKDRPRFVVLEDDFAGGARFHCIRDAWRGDPHRCARLHVITVSTAIAGGVTAQPLADEWVGLGPPITPNLHRLAFDGGRIQWLLLPTPWHTGLRELVAEVDAFALRASSAVDGFAARRRAKALARLARVGSTVWREAASTSEHDTTAHAMRSAGFDSFWERRPLDSLSLWERLPPDSLSLRERAGVRAAHGDSADLHAPHPTLSPDGRGSQGWRYAPSFTPRHAPSRSGAGAPSTTRVLVIGGGLAGCAMAWALAEQGRESTVFERHGALASETSGNTAGLFHGIVNPQDGAHARFNRAAALEAQRAVTMAVQRHGVPGAADGLLRLEIGAPGDAALPAMKATLERLSLPADYVQALSARDASARSGLPLLHPAWWYPGGGWVQPGGLARSFIERAGARVALRLGCAVESLTREPQGWALRGAGGEVLAQSDVVVLANAGDALRLLRPWVPIAPLSGVEPRACEPGIWPLRKVRGQISMAARADCAARPWPQVPITGAGYLLPPVGGRLIFGATSQVGDNDPAVRESDHHRNLELLARLLGETPCIDAHRLSGRTGWRWSAFDRLPVLGAVPDLLSAMDTSRLEHVAQVPRLPGLYACTGWGSRGITWAALSAQVVAASITGAPMPLEASLLDRVDATRFVVRGASRGSGRGR